MTTHPVSPNTVPANALHHAEDALAPRILATRPERIVLVVGTQINGASHMQSLASAMAARLRDRFGLPTAVPSSAPDNAPYVLATDPAGGHRYQRAYAQALGERALLVLGCPRALAEGPAGAGRRKGWRAGPTEPGNVFVMFFQTPIHE
ncbi:hypothetical protein [Streptomyces sp. NPDC004728]|uniref:hypothetical protein n=1 Tax=Streptomyces sp. NPDC004728 TaxID=3154289 RepID=UPI0033BD4FEA